MNGVYTALCLPCSSLEARVATLPSTLPLASMTCHRLSALFALAINVRMKRESLLGPVSRVRVVCGAPSRQHAAWPTTANPDDMDGCQDCQGFWAFLALPL